MNILQNILWSLQIVVFILPKLLKCGESCVGGADTTCRKPNDEKNNVELVYTVAVGDTSKVTPSGGGGF